MVRFTREQEDQSDDPNQTSLSFIVCSPNILRLCNLQPTSFFAISKAASEALSISCISEIIVCSFNINSFASSHLLLQSHSIVEVKFPPTYSTGPLPTICIAAPPHRVSHSGPKTRKIDSLQCTILFIPQTILAPFCSGFACHSKVD
jgi:hypothetical protein